MKKLKKLTKSKLKPGQVVYERRNNFYLDDVGDGYELIEPLKNSELLSFIPGCEETDDKEQNCNVYVMQKWLVKNFKTSENESKVITAYLARWETAYIKYNNIVSFKEEEEDNIENSDQCI
jgi:hypothetical protein